MINNQNAVIIVARGKGTRMGASLPKQFMLLGDKPILMHTLERFHSYDKFLTLILVLPVDQQQYWLDLCKKFQFNLSVKIADGGETRFHSVRNGLSKLTTEKYVGVHDGVRPFVSVEVIRRCYETVRKHKAVIPTIPVVDSLRQLDEQESRTVDRSAFCLVQTPQVFCSDVLQRAYQQEYAAAFTDDASVVEALGYPITLIEGNRENIKVTTPFDLRIGEALL